MSSEIEKPLNVLILYDSGSTYTSTVLEYLQSFKQYSRHTIFFAVGSQFNSCDLLLDAFDAVIVHYSIRLAYGINFYGSSLSKSYYNALRRYRGFKALIVQDEYEKTNTTKQLIKELGFNLVYTCVPERSIQKIYPREEFPETEFISVLTGYVSGQDQLKKFIKPLSERENILAYRGRLLPFWYGDLGQEKYQIGVEMKRICEEKKIKADIECQDTKRIYGDAWYEFLANARATLGTESGANIFDFTGELRTSIERALKKNPELTYSEARAIFLKGHEGFVSMNQISPKVFEAIALRTALVLFEGEYSGVIEPHRHYIPLKKDFSNVDDVLEKLNDLAYLEELTNRTYKEIIQEGHFSYQNFIGEIDRDLSRRVVSSGEYSIISTPLILKKNNAASYHFMMKEDFIKQGKSLGIKALASNEPFIYSYDLELSEAGKRRKSYYEKISRHKSLVPIRDALVKILPPPVFRVLLRIRYSLFKV